MQAATGQFYEPLDDTGERVEVQYRIEPMRATVRWSVIGRLNGETVLMLDDKVLEIGQGVDADAAVRATVERAVRAALPDIRKRLRK